MKIGKQVKRVTSPRREIRKAEPRPVQVPIKEPEKVEKYSFNWRFHYGIGVDISTKKDLSVITTVGV